MICSAPAEVFRYFLDEREQAKLCLIFFVPAVLSVCLTHCFPRILQIGRSFPPSNLLYFKLFDSDACEPPCNCSSHFASVSVEFYALHLGNVSVLLADFNR